MIDECFRLHFAIRSIKSANTFLIWLNFIFVSLSYIPEALEVLAGQIKGKRGTWGCSPGQAVELSGRLTFTFVSLFILRRHGSHIVPNPSSPPSRKQSLESKSSALALFYLEESQPVPVLCSLCKTSSRISTLCERLWCGIRKLD